MDLKLSKKSEKQKGKRSTNWVRRSIRGVEAFDELVPESFSNSTSNENDLSQNEIKNNLIDSLVPETPVGEIQGSSFKADDAPNTQIEEEKGGKVNFECGTNEKVSLQGSDTGCDSLKTNNAKAEAKQDDQGLPEIEGLCGPKDQMNFNELIDNETDEEKKSRQDDENGKNIAPCKKRGRPPKCLQIPTESSSPREAIPLKRKRGRPRKSESDHRMSMELAPPLKSIEVMLSSNQHCDGANAEKNLEKSSKDLMTEENNLGLITKKKRGRPKKIKIGSKDGGNVGDKGIKESSVGTHGEIVHSDAKNQAKKTQKKHLSNDNMSLSIADEV